MELLYQLLIIAAITALPAIELRGAIPVGIAMGLPPLLVFAVAVITNILIIFPIVFFLERFFPFLRRVKKFDWILNRIHNKTQKYVDRGGHIGLLLFVAIPLPGSGVFSGALAAYIFNVEKKKAIFGMSAGVIIAGVIIALVSYGVIGFFF